MQLTRLRLAGFKTFVDPTDVPIEPGLNGIVGPNGCGKSNLVEAMRWAMGESSHRSLRASEMDDVIFAGNHRRAARNLAEVSLRLDNSDRRAPAEFNSGDEIEIVRTITRGSGSSYRVNGREARARDVQTLFADVSSGARSPALIGQGRVSEIINARPEQRRRLLEDAAGIAGLAARRHEAELRLNAASQNLERAEDVLRQMDGRIDALRRQARTAVRYRQLSTDLRRTEQARALLAWREAQSAMVEAERAAAAAVAAVAEALAAQGQAAREEAIAEHAMPVRRDAAAAASANARDIATELAGQQAAERATRSRLQELSSRSRTAEDDLGRERQLLADAEASLQRLSTEKAGDIPADESDVIPQLEQALADAESALNQAEASLACSVEAEADANARRRAAQRAVEDLSTRLGRAGREKQRLEAAAPTAGVTAQNLADLREAVQIADEAIESGEKRVAEADSAHAAAQAAEREAQARLADAEKQAATLATELATLRKFVAASRKPGEAGSLLDAISVERGFERATAAAFGDSLDGSLEPKAARRWQAVEASGDPALPDGAEPLIDHVGAPPALQRGLRQIGLVESAAGNALQARLATGQVLVSREGGMWRWDGFTVSADAPPVAAKILEERNRLDELTGRSAAASGAADLARRTLQAAREKISPANALRSKAQDALRAARGEAATARSRLADSERRAAAEEAAGKAHQEALARAVAAFSEAESAHRAAASELAGLAEPAGLTETVAASRAEAERLRSGRSEATAALQTERRAIAERENRRAALARDLAAWSERQSSAVTRIAELEARLVSLAEEEARLIALPDEALAKARVLASALSDAETAAQEAAELLARAESERSDRLRAARAALDRLAQTRESGARSEERLSAAREKLAESLKAITEDLDLNPASLAEAIGPLQTTRADLEADIQRLTRERDRLGPVNLAADSELTEVDQARQILVSEREDIEAAIRELRRGIQTLNEEGRLRLIAAFDRVDANFRRLFQILFGGGEASLELIETGDPLGAGLEVNAQPPGKRPHTLSLLSGGEQALTALALVFAVFLTSPSPICVMDEVDAPLDDANVERFCGMLDAMIEQTATRFLVVTHNPITMSRMNRLIGVTMAERGVSQLVTVALAEAERMREAG